MARNPETKGYVSWRDVMAAWEWFQRGYGVVLQLRGHVACPKGWTDTKFFYELEALDSQLQQIALPRRILAAFPGSSGETKAGMMLRLLYEMDSLLSEHRIWTEPPVGKAPDRGAA